MDKDNFDNLRDDQQIKNVYDIEKDDAADVEAIALEIINRHRKAYEKLAE
jgi:hypothetical protein